MKNIIHISILCFLFTSALAQDKKKDYAEAFKLVDVWLDAQKDFDRLPGISAIVVEDQEVLWAGAAGMSNVEKGTKTETSTICSICSISKLFTSVAIMILYDEGKLRLDDLVSDVLPAYKVQQKYPESGPITIRSLMTHSSGLPREAAYPYWTGPDFPFPSQEEINAKLGEQETLYPSSTYFQYSNLALTLLGEIVQEISGVPFEQYVQEKILTPLELSDTRTELPADLHGAQLAVGHSSLSREGKRQPVKIFQANGITPAAGFSANVLDLGKFASWQFRLRDTTTAEILRSSTIKYMHNVHWTDPDWRATWGLGFRVYKGSNGSTWVGHGGSCPGYRSTLELDLKNKRAFAVMINASGTNPMKYVKWINEIMDKVKASKEKDSSSETKDLQEYVGYYSPMPWWSEVYIGTWNGKLVALSLPSDNPGQSMTYYKHIEGDTFRRVRDDDELGETLVFERDEEGKIIHYIRHGNYKKRIVR